MFQLGLAGTQRVRDVLAIGAHADDLEIGCGATVLALTRAHRDVAVHWVVLAAPGPRGDEARASAEGCWRRRGDDDRSPWVSRRVSPIRRGGGEGRVRGHRLARRSPARPHAHQGRSAPGPSARVRADVEHVQGPPDPRVRDTEVGRRPRTAERLRAAHGGAGGGEARPAPGAFREPARKHWFDARGLPGADASPRDGVSRARGVRRGLHRPKADTADRRREGGA